MSTGLKQTVSVKQLHYVALQADVEAWFLKVNVEKVVNK